jgi:hypothetical protein
MKEGETAEPNKVTIYWQTVLHQGNGRVLVRFLEFLVAVN